MAALLALNVLWNGLGNIAIGDRRGWGLGFLNWVFFILSLFTLFVPALAFYAVCGYLGYDFLRKQEEKGRGWYYADNGQKIGPFAAPELARLINASTVTARTFVWQPGQNEWTPAGETPGFPVDFTD